MSHELAVEHVLDAPVAAVWRAWTEHLAEWWSPLPWRTELHALELHPGGRFATTMFGPDGERHPGDGVILEVAPERRVVFTNALLPGWQPQAGTPFSIVGVFAFAPEGSATRYRAASRHWNAADRDRHVAMGFDAGWTAATRQLEAVARRLAAAPA